jgi:hypothetical protein
VSRSCPTPRSHRVRGWANRNGLLDRSRKELGSDKRSRRQHNSLRRCSPRLGRWAERTDSKVRRHCAGRDGAFAEEIIHPGDHEAHGEDIRACFRVAFTTSPLVVSSMANICWRARKSHPINSHLGLLRSELCRVNTEQSIRAVARPASLRHQSGVCYRRVLKKDFISRSTSARLVLLAVGTFVCLRAGLFRLFRTHLFRPLPHGLQ